MYTDDLWEKWSLQESGNYQIKNGKKLYLKKGYLHFDHLFWFPDRKEEIRSVLRSKLIVPKPPKSSHYWSFTPFQKILLKTPRYRYQEKDEDYGLDTKVRPISFASHIDSLILGFYAYGLTRQYQNYIIKNKFSDCVLAYRSDLSGKCNIQFSKEVFDYVKQKGNCTAICLDIKGYFDNIDHQLLKKNWAKVLGDVNLPEDQYRIYKILTQYSYVNKNSIYKKYHVELKNRQNNLESPRTLFDVVPGKNIDEKYKRLKADKLIVTNDKLNKKTNTHIGIPQGSPMSSVLSNIYLIDYDKDMMKKSQDEGFLYRRYCDDILIVCDKHVADMLQSFTIDKIKSECFLTIQDRKVETIEFMHNSKKQLRAFNKRKMKSAGVTAISDKNEKLFYKNLQYLGFEFSGQDVLIRSSSLSRYYRKLKGRIIKTVSMAYSGKQNKEKIFYEKLNSKIFKEQLYHKYTHLGKRNFLKYAYNASQKNYTNSIGELKDGFNSIAIKKQVRRHFDILISTLSKKNYERYKWKLLKDKPKPLKEI